MMESDSVRTTAWNARACRMVAAFFLLSGLAFALDCSNLPTSFGGNEFPTGDFFSNFNNSCYTIALSHGNGETLYGDLNAKYYLMYYKVDPRYQLILVSAFPNARYYSVVLYDEHSALSQNILDTSIVPLTPNYANPYLPGVPFADGQQYAMPIDFGGKPGNQQTGCMTTGYTLAPNRLDATQRHPGMDWNSDAAFFEQYPTFDNHIVDNAEHRNPNTAGVVMIRAYLDDTTSSYVNNPHIIVRDVASGCAYPADYAVNTLQIVSTDRSVAGGWADAAQVTDHHIYTTHLPTLCEGAAPSPNRLPWSRVEQYVPWTNPDASYIAAGVPAGLTNTLTAAGQVMRIRVRLPSTPPTPCTNGCSRSGDEQMRYMSLSFGASDGSVYASIADNAFTQDANGYATLIVGTGTTVPSWITPANGYTFLDLTQFTNYQNLSLITLRHMVPASSFNCAGQFVPYRMSPQIPTGSLMADYMPVIDYPAAASLPPAAVPLIGPAACGSFPIGQPGTSPACAVLQTPPPAITDAVTECHQPTCNHFVAQSNPPVTISGSGFGSFPNGFPFTGTSAYLRITDTTQNWVAGYTKSACTVSVESWDVGSIQLIANVNRAAACPLVAGDQVLIEVWNPQTMVEASTTVTVLPPEKP